MLNVLKEGTWKLGCNILDRVSAAEFLATAHATSTTLSPSRQEVVAYDLEGRPQLWFSRGETFKRSLASELYGRRSDGGVRRRWKVGAAHSDSLLKRALEVAALARTANLHGAVKLAGNMTAASGVAELEQRLQRILAWTPDALLTEGQRFGQVYQPVSILPPDQYQAVVLQASFGCSWNRCTFCTFYQDRPFRIRPEAEFAAHARSVKEFLGAAAAARNSVFLADGNALVLANSRLRPIFTVAATLFPNRPVNAFVDVFSGEKKPAAQWQELAELGLDRVAIGVETGNDELLAWLNKPGSSAEAAAFVTLLKSAGLRVSVILMVGVGGERFAAAHVADSLRLLERMPLGSGDLIYLSPFVVQPGSAYEQRARDAGQEPLAPTELDAQYRLLRTGARQVAPEARVALYHIDEFIY